MQSPRYVAKYGAIRFLSCPGRAAIVSKFRAVSGTACKMPSPTPPKSAKVELRINHAADRGDLLGDIRQHLRERDRREREPGPQQCRYSDAGHDVWERSFGGAGDVVGSLAAIGLAAIGHEMIPLRVHGQFLFSNLA